MIQSKADIETAAMTPDHWGYKTNPADQFRLRMFLGAVAPFGPFERCLDIGAYEGFLTQFFPAKELWGYEISDLCAQRFPKVVQRANPPKGKFDLVVATGIWYNHYDTKHFLELIRQYASRIILTSAIGAWENHDSHNVPGRLIDEKYFVYHAASGEEFQQHLRVWDVSK